MDERTDHNDPSPPAGGLPPLVWIPATILFAGALVLLFV